MKVRLENHMKRDHVVMRYIVLDEEMDPNHVP